MHEGLIAAYQLLIKGKAHELLQVLEEQGNIFPDEAYIILAWAAFQNSNPDIGWQLGAVKNQAQRIGDHTFAEELLSWVAPSPRDIVEDSEIFNRATKNAQRISLWTPLRNFCQNHCPKSANACIAVGASTTWATGLFPLRSPLASIISNEQYWASDRVVGDLARLIPDVKSWNNNNEFVELDRCYFNAMQVAQEKFGHAK